jgi:glucokinase
VPESKLALAVDLGGTKVDAALVTADGALVDGSRHRQPTGADITADKLEAAIRSVVTSALGSVPAGAELTGVGIGSAGPVSPQTGEISPLNMPGCWDFPIVSIVAAASSGLPVTLRLDGQAITLAEHWIGALKGYSNALGMVVSTGIGGGLLIDGRIASGKSGNAGHVGQVRVSAPTAGGANNESTLEGTASGPHIVAWAQSQGWKGKDGEDLAASYAKGDPIAIAAVYRCGETVGLALATIAAVTDLEAVAIGGGFSRVTPDLFDIIRATLRERSPLRTMQGILVVPSGLSDEGPLIGAAGLVHRADLLPVL